MLETLKKLNSKLNSKLDEIEKEYAQTPISNFAVFTDFMMKVDPLCTQGRVLSDTANDKDFKQDELFLTSLARAPEIIFPSKEEIFKHHEVVQDFVLRTIMLQAKLDKDGQKFIEGRDPSVLYYKFLTELYHRHQSKPAASPASQAPVQALPHAAAKSRDDEGVSFMKRTGFLIKKN